MSFRSLYNQSENTMKCYCESAIRAGTIPPFTYKGVTLWAPPPTPTLSVPLKGSTVCTLKVGRWVTGTLAWHTESTLTVEILFKDAEPNGCLSLHESKQVITRRAGAVLKGVLTTVRPFAIRTLTHHTRDVPAMEWNRPHIHTPFPTGICRNNLTEVILMKACDAWRV